MEDSNTLVKQFKIEIPVYIGDSDKKRKENLKDSELSNGIVRLHFLEKIKRVIIYTLYRNGGMKYLYYYEDKNGN